jgi:hypothetical protein
MCHYNVKDKSQDDVHAPICPLIHGEESIRFDPLKKCQHGYSAFKLNPRGLCTVQIMTFAFAIFLCQWKNANSVEVYAHFSSLNYQNYKNHKIIHPVIYCEDYVKMYYIIR